MEWLPAEKLAWRPPERLTVSEWADKYRVLDAQTSSKGGMWNTSKTPYLREVMDSFSTEGIEKVTLCCGSQLGKTEALLNMQGYAICQDPGPMLMVYPSEDIAKRFANRRLKKTIFSTPSLAERYIGKESSGLEFQFSGMFLLFGWSGSASALSSTPCRYVLNDEVDKFEERAGVEQDPVALAEERTKTFEDKKKIVLASTPTTEIGPIWVSLEASDVVKGYFVPCPHCGTYQRLSMHQVKWPDGIGHKRVRAAAWYECNNSECGRHIEDRHKKQMLLDGMWKPVKWVSEDHDWVMVEPPDYPVRKIAFQLSSLYSPWLTWGEMAEKWLEAQTHPSKLMNFVNGWLGEPFVADGARMRSDSVMSMRDDYKKGEVPENVIGLTMGVDCQKGHFYYVVRGWGENLTSWLIDYDRVETWSALSNVLRHVYKGKDNAEHIVCMAFVDSGYAMTDTYNFCAANLEVSRPCKGSSLSMKSLFSPSTVDKGEYAGFLKLYMVDGGKGKDFIASRLLLKPEEPGAWRVPTNVDREYADQICSEQKVVTKRKNGSMTEEWKPLGSHTANHYLDCEVYAYAAAEAMQVRFWEKPELQPTQEPVAKESNWLSSSSSSW